jgi:hypothetical protein
MLTGFNIIITSEAGKGKESRIKEKESLFYTIVVA